jgi:predicted molibdopterin-dependent oxidoreductase YjgC
VRCLYVIGENPMTSDPDLNHVREALRNTEFLVLQEIFPSETAHYADVVLPAASWAEKEGTFTNTERRIQRVRKAVPPPGQARLDSWIVAELAKRMIALGAAAPDPDAPYADWAYDGPEDVMAEINALTPIYAGVTYGG